MKQEDRTSILSRNESLFSPHEVKLGYEMHLPSPPRQESGGLAPHMITLCQPHYLFYSEVKRPRQPVDSKTDPDSVENKILFPTRN